MADKLEGEVDVEVIDPATGLPTDDPTLAAAIKRNVHFVTRRGKTVVQWRPFIRPLRTYTDIPAHFGFTEAEAQTFMKMCNESLVPLSVVCKVWGKPYEYGMKFIIAKQIPVFMDIFGNKPHVFSGDLTRAIESCRIDMEKDGGAWPKYFLWVRKQLNSKKAKKDGKKAQRRSGSIPGSPDGAADEDGGKERLDDAAAVLETAPRQPEPQKVHPEVPKNAR
jgi:hypothetical protein